jgi:TrmH family RNA methyltransferase
MILVPDRVMDELSSTETAQGVITLVRPPEHSMDELFSGQALVVILDGIQDPGNAGAILRAAEAFGATGAVFLKGSVNPFNPKCMRASAGSIFRLPFVPGITPDAIPETKLYAAMPRAKLDVSETDFTQACAVVIGSEGAGVSGELASRSAAFRISTSQVESLNASVAAGIVLYEARRQRGRA